jgi:hypothetical protein
VSTCFQWTLPICFTYSLNRGPLNDAYFYSAPENVNHTTGDNVAEDATKLTANGIYTIADQALMEAKNADKRNYVAYLNNNNELVIYPRSEPNPEQARLGVQTVHGTPENSAQP